MAALLGENKGGPYSWVRVGEQAQVRALSPNYLREGGREQRTEHDQPQHATSTKLPLHPVPHINHSPPKTLPGGGARRVARSGRLPGLGLLKSWSFNAVKLFLLEGL